MSHPSLFRLRTAALCAGLALSACATNQMVKSEELTKAAEARSDYVATLAHFDAAQIELGRLAMSRSDNLRIRAYGQQLVEQHSRHLQALREWAQARDLEANAVARINTNLGVGGSGVGGAGFGVPVEATAQQIEGYQRIAQGREIHGGKALAELDRLEGTRFDRDLLSLIKTNQERAQNLVRRGARTYAADPVFASLLAKTEPEITANLRDTERLIKRVD